MADNDDPAADGPAHRAELRCEGIAGTSGFAGNEGEKGGWESLERKQLCAANTARDIASLPPLSGGRDDAPVFARTPVFLGHGRHDEGVSVELGQEARDVLEALGCKVRWHDYDEGHWYKVPDEIDDIADFLTEIMDDE